MTSGGVAADATPRALVRRLRPLQVAVGLQGMALWVAVEKLFMSQIGFDAGSVAVMAAAYAAVVPLLEMPSGILADRGSRRLMMVAATVALAASSLLGGLSRNVPTYIAAARAHRTPLHPVRPGPAFGLKAMIAKGPSPGPREPGAIRKPDAQGRPPEPDGHPPR